MAKKRKRRQQPKQKSRVPMTAVLIVAGVAVLAVSLLIILNSGQAQTTTVVTELTYETGVTPEGEPYKGSPEAPLQLVEYSDFLCPHCSTFSTTIDGLAPDYIETGVLQVIFRNYAFLATESVQAAQAAECALDQGADKFWQYIECFIKEGKSDECSEEAGIDESALDECMTGTGIDYAAEDFELANAALAECAEARGSGCGSPTLTLNGEYASEFDYGGRTADAVKELLCSAFEDAPEECDEKLSDEQAARSFSETYSETGSSGGTATCG